MTPIIILTALLTATLVALIALSRTLRRTRHELDDTRTQLTDVTAQPAIISHEIRTPLALIRGAGELLAEESPGKLNDVQASFVRTINENSRLVSDIAENFLTDLHLQKGDITFTTIDIRTIAANAAAELRKVSDIPIHIDAVGGLLPLNADERLIRQLMWNLITNAARHAGDDATILVHIENGEGGGVHISIIDTGEGMDDDDLARLFVPFASGSTRRPGSGIGMMVSRKIVDLHGGQIFVDSSPTIGTAIHIILPQNASEQAE
ncbi:HAMP domain-containing histidine kinase [Arcanobacterium haemolyticum]|nr:HAMP domain-containing histidine kinase [Arcanobacterium haemolyticum]